MNEQIYEEAANWLVEFRTGDSDPDTRRRFDAWIRKSPEHLRAYLEITEIWQDASFVGTDEDSTAAQLVSNARTADNVVTWRAAEPGASVPAPARAEPAVRVRRRVSRAWLAAAASLAIVAVGAMFYWQEQRNTYTTGVGEQRLINLSDGSTVRLNARSKVRIHFTEGLRGVDLLQGQAFFHVAKDAHRPFLVRSDTTQARAVGTQFDVYRRASGTTVTVVEGRVAVAPAAPLISEAPSEGSGTNALVSSDGGGSAAISLPNEIVLAAGEQVTVTEKAASPVQKANATIVTAWTQHQLVFKSSSLAEVVEEFNRYNTRKLVIEGTELSDFHVSGVYSSTDPSLLLRFLREQPNIRVQETETEIRISRAP